MKGIPLTNFHLCSQASYLEDHRPERFTNQIKILESTQLKKKKLELQRLFHPLGTEAEESDGVS